MTRISVDDYPRTPEQRLADEASEFEHQSAVFQWAALQAKCGCRELELLHASQNGLHTSPAQAGKAKAAGMRSGVPDIHLPVARGGFTGLWIEMKSSRGRLRASQEWWRDRLMEEGGFWAMCFTSSQAIQTLTEYIDGKHVRMP